MVAEQVEVVAVDGVVDDLVGRDDDSLDRVRAPASPLRGTA